MRFLLLAINPDILTYLIGALVFLALYFFLVIKFSFKKAGAVKKLFLSVVPFTIVFIVFLAIYFTMCVNGMYASVYAANMGAIGGILNSASTNYNPTLVQSQIGGVFNNGNGLGNINAFILSNGLIWFVVAIVIYFLTLAIIFAIVLKPIKEVNSSIEKISNGGKLEKLKLKGKTFGEIKENLLRTQKYIESLVSEIQRIRTEYSKVIPKQAIQLMGKKDISEISAGQNVSRNCYVISIKNRKICASVEEDLSRVNKLYTMLSPIIRNYNGTIFSYSMQLTNCIFISKNSCNECVCELKSVISKNNLDCQVEMQSRMITLGIVGYAKQYSFEIFF